MSKEALNKIETHEKECTIRYQNIEKRLDEGAKRFTRIELLIIGLYAGMACLLYTSPSPRDRQKSRMPSSA